MNGMLARSLTLLIAMGCFEAACAQAVSGEGVYQARCASCHDASPLQKIAASNILRELNSGVMASIGSQLSRAEREAVASYLGTPDRAAVNAGVCRADDRVASSANLAGAWNGWSPSATNTRFQENPGLSVDQVSKLKLKWAFGFEGDTIVFSLPSVIGSNVFVGSNSGKVHALDTQSGCTRWTFQAEAGVRSAIVTVPIGQTHALLFGDRGGWFYSLEAETGKLLWKKKVDDHEGARITGAPVANEGIVYVPVASVEETLARRTGYVCCTFRGSLVALRIADGSQVWKTYMIPEHAGSGVAVWSAPTLDPKRGLLYIGTGNNYSEPATAMSDSIVALEMKTGRIAWFQQTLPGDILNGR
jgi:polyvinyl alcohol dehydrogenase (cytochrome)